jgi:hypothetical protein
VRTANITAILKMEAIRISETPVYFFEITRCYIPKGYHIHTRRRENLKSQDNILLRVREHLKKCLNGRIRRMYKTAQRGPLCVGSSNIINSLKGILHLNRNLFKTSVPTSKKTQRIATHLINDVYGIDLLLF